MEQSCLLQIQRMTVPYISFSVEISDCPIYLTVQNICFKYVSHHYHSLVFHGFFK